MLKNGRAVLLCLAVVVGLSVTAADGQSRVIEKRVSPSSCQGDVSQQPRQDVGSQQPPATEMYEMTPGVYVRPGPYSPTYMSPRYRSFRGYHRKYHDSRRRADRRWPTRSYSHHQHFRRYERGYDDWYGYDPYTADLDDAYEQGRYDADHDYIWYIATERAGRILNQYKQAFDEGILLFRNGQYERAAVNWLGAAEKNHASAAARLHAGHALFALGQYQGATKLITRAFELAPSLAYKHYDMRDEYGNPDDFAVHLAALEDFVQAHPTDVASVTLLGYALYFTVGPSAARPMLERAAKLDPKSYFIPKLLRVSRQTSPDPRLGEPDGAEREEDTHKRPESSRASSGMIRVVRGTDFSSGR